MRNRRADGAKLRNLRVRRQLRQKDLADRASVRADTLSNIEAGRWQPSDLLAFRLAQALDCDVDDFIEAPAVANSDAA